MSMNIIEIISLVLTASKNGESEMLPSGGQYINKLVLNHYEETVLVSCS